MYFSLFDLLFSSFSFRNGLLYFGRGESRQSEDQDVYLYSFNNLHKNRSLRQCSLSDRISSWPQEFGRTKV